jgi:hypothetical protein
MTEELERIAADLHTHTALSPCAEERATPPAIVKAALERGLGLIAVTDHNTAGNAEAVVRCGERYGLKVLPGIEVMTREEAHVVCLFDDVESALKLEDAIAAALPAFQNDAALFGRQVLMNEHGEETGEIERMLQMASDISVERLAELARGLGGLVVAAHIDRPANSVVSNLGFIPERARFDALEITANTGKDEAAKKFPGAEGYPLIRSSDAHAPEQVGISFTLFLIARPTTAEIRLALWGECGREYLVE